MRARLEPIGLVIRNVQLRRLQLAWAASSLGSCAYLIAIMVVAFRSGGAGSVGLLMLIRMGAAAVAAAPLSALADRYPRRHVMALSDVARAALTAGLAVFTQIDAPIETIYALAAAVAIVATVFRPAQAAITPSLAATPEELTAANAVAGTIESTSIFLGPGIGGLVLAVSGSVAVLVVCLAAFLWSALLAWSVDEPARADAAAEAEGASTSTLEGFRTLARSRALLAVTITYGAQAMVAGALGVFAVVLAIDVLHMGNPGVGYLDCAFGVGGILGGFASFGLAGAPRLAAAFTAGVLAWGVGVALLGVTATTVFILVLLAGVGVGNTVVDVAAMTLLQRSADDAVLGRVFGVIETVLLASMGLGSILAPLAIKAVGVRAALIGTGLILPVVVLVFSRSIAALDRPGPEVAERAELLRANAIFRPLADAALETLARALAPEQAAAGAEVVRQGEQGDRVYLVTAGELDVTVDGRPGGRLGRGDVFGEIALLRDVPRTATVRAVTDAELLTLGRDEFLSAVTGHPASAAEADMVVATRLAALRPGVVQA